MSLVNAWVDRNCALLGADEEAYTPEGEVCGRIDKLIPIVRLNAAIGFRGHVLAQTILRSLVGICTRGFDEMFDTLPQLVEQAFINGRQALNQLRRDQPSHALEIPVDQAEVVLVGYAGGASKGCMYRWNGNDAHERQEIPHGQGLFGPADERFIDEILPEPPMTAAKLGEVALRQKACMARFRPGEQPLGGRFFVIEMNAGGMRITSPVGLGAWVR